jgi:hypothetical protein
MSKRDNRIIRDAVNWISKIRPECQMEELTRATQRNFIRQAKGMQGICLACAVGFAGTLIMSYSLEHMVEELEEKQLKMQMDIDIMKTKVYDDDEN